MEPNGEFHSVIVFVESLGPGGPSPVKTGYWLYGWISQHLQAVEPELGVRLHGSRALTVSPLLEGSSATVATTIRTGERYAFRLTFLEGDGYAGWRDRLWPQLQPILKVGSQAFRLVDWTEESRLHPLADRRSLGELARWGEQHADGPISLAFLTPTLFKSTYQLPQALASDHPKPIDVEIPLPDPTRIINSLGGRWQRFAPPAAGIPDRLLDMAKQTTGISRFSLRTESVQAKSDVRGFVGWVEFRCLAPLPEARAVFATLCRFATFAGIGNKTALGLGMVQLLP